MVVCPLVNFRCTMVEKCVKALVDMVFGVLSDVPPIENKMFYKRIPIIIARQKIISMKKTTSTFMFHVVMVGGLVLEVVFASFTIFIFFVMT